VELCPCYVGPIRYGMAHPRVADGGDGLQVRRVDAIILSKQSRTAGKGWSSLVVGQRDNISLP